MNNSERIVEIKQRLNAALNPISLEISDDSAAHVGHAGASTGAGHFSVSIISDAFNGKGQVACHQLVYKAVGDLMENDIHALRIQAKGTV